VSNYSSIPIRKFYRSRDRAVVGGVCAGLADYFGFNLKMTRALAVISLLMAMPVTLLAYFGTVFLVPAAANGSLESKYDPEFRKAVRSAPRQTVSEVRRRFQSLDNRMARLERYVTSSRFNLDQEFRNL
jgi:phage shock protein C